MNTIEEMAKAYANEKYGDYADAVGHFAGMEDFIAGYKAASPLRWVKVKDDLPKKDGLYIVVHNQPGGYCRHEMFFKTEDKKWYWQPNPYSVCGDGFITEWLDEGNADDHSDVKKEKL